MEIMKNLENLKNLNKKDKTRLVARLILMVLIVINCIVIFRFSAQQAESSNKTSGVVVNTIIEKSPRTKNLPPKEKEKKKKEIVTPVRKTGHFTVYTSLGILIYLCAKTFKGGEKKKILISVLLAFLYACTDEIHQLFVNGRSGEFRDVCIDTSGALFGALLIWVICFIAGKIKAIYKRKKDKKIRS